MILKRVLPFAHSLLANAVHDGDIAIDATIGNGNDTALLAELVGEQGKVYGFDIQEKALENTYTLLKEKQLDNRATLFHESHDQIEILIPKDETKKVKAAIFNLGYLPGGDKNIVTTPSRTINAIRQLLSIMPYGGIIILVVYHGHPEGMYERDALLEFVATIEQKQANVLKYEFLNQKNHPPFIIAIEKK
ncbi:class I SAM-dependent methyltransferase [Bacillus sp. Marseille-P3661]|uniref:class I SAM-dependent methyltransferase n=1 Tax=Bacillus sp. Marseille-P3661 TaxID=1936234 RepID=UPI000C8683DC|nr:class I SAM-dependent methyltransferase [Bacillus sp. Marseille-P3661]